ncbi:MAG: phosphoesterase [Bacteroidota bacterium]|nr:phosphoesterase [Bacteroidota bacterium]
MASLHYICSVKLYHLSTPAKKLYAKLKNGFHAALSGFLNSTTVKKFAAKYPRAYKIFIDRFSLDEFTGLPLTFLLLSFFANGFVLSELVNSFKHSAGIVLLDNSFTQWMYSLRVEWLAQAFYWFSKLGSFGGVVTMAVISVIAMWMRDKKIFIVPVLISLLGSDLTMSMAKKYFHRVRPEDFWYYHEVDFSFPSGHATISVAFYGALFYALIRTRRKYASKFRWMIAAVMFIGLLGFSRLYLCVHYLSDVIAGYSLGLLWLLLGISIAEWRMHKKKVKGVSNKV